MNHEAPACNGLGSWVRSEPTTAARTAGSPPTSLWWALETLLTLTFVSLDWIPPPRSTTRINHNNRFPGIHIGTPACIRSTNYGPQTSSGWLLHHDPPEERYLHPAHQLHRLPRRSSGIRNALNPHRPDKGHPTYQHHLQRTNPSPNRHPEPYGAHHEYPRPDLRPAASRPKHHHST